MTTRTLYLLTATVCFAAAALSLAAWQMSNQLAPLCFGFCMAGVGTALIATSRGEA